MPTRILRLSERFNRAVRRLGVAGTPAGQALASTLVSMQQETLPGPLDAEAMMPPTAIYWFRRIPGQNLWLYFSWSNTELYAVSLTARPPVPLSN